MLKMAVFLFAFFHVPNIPCYEDNVLVPSRAAEKHTHSELVSYYNYYNCALRNYRARSIMMMIMMGTAITIPEVKPGKFAKYINVRNMCLFLFMKLYYNW